MGGLWPVAPRMGGVAMLFFAPRLGLPGMGNFVGEFLVLLGSWQANAATTVMAGTGLIGATAYAVWMMHTTFFSVAKSEWKFPDFSVREMAVAAVMIAAIMATGLYPQPVLDASADTMQRLQKIMQSAQYPADPADQKAATAVTEGDR